MYLSQILSYPYKPYNNRKLIYSFRWCINLNFKTFTLMAGFVVHICTSLRAQDFFGMCLNSFYPHDWTLNSSSLVHDLRIWCYEVWIWSLISVKTGLLNQSGYMKHTDLLMSCVFITVWNIKVMYFLFSTKLFNIQLNFVMYHFLKALKISF